jgi:hypothetical protein
MLMTMPFPASLPQHENVVQPADVPNGIAAPFQARRYPRAD